MIRPVIVEILNERVFRPPLGSSAFGPASARTHRTSPADADRRAFRSHPPAAPNRGTIPSTPATRPSLLSHTRSHAAIKNAGLCTRLNTSSSWRPRSAAAQRCSFVCITRTRCHAVVVSPTSFGHGTPVFTGVSPSHASVAAKSDWTLRQVVGFPNLGLLRALRPWRQHQSATDLPVQPGLAP